MFSIPFVKMHGLGNDFVVVDGRGKKGQADSNHPYASELLSNPALVKKIMDRHHGVGGDQMVLITHDTTSNTTARMQIVNSDGSHAETCGNAARCVALLLHRAGAKKELTIASGRRLLAATVLETDGQKNNGRVTVDMGSGNFTWQAIPLRENCDTMHLPLDQLFAQLDFTPLHPAIAVNVGNPHCVLLVDDADKTDIEKIGRAIENHPLFPERTNVAFVSASDQPTVFRLRMWERGAGATLACGSGAVATFLALQRMKKITTATMVMDGGPLRLSATSSSSVLMDGPAALIFHGELYL